MTNQTGWVTSLGSNSASINYPPGASITDLKDTIEGWITAHGWALYDASAGTNARAYRALNADGSTYKYVVIDVNSAPSLFIKTYESWNSSTHAGTNLASLSATAAQAQRYDLTGGGILYMFAQAKYLIMQSSVLAGIGSSIGNSFCGCVEITRDNPEDTVAAGYPCFGWVNGNILFQTYGPWSSPRLRDGTIGTNAQSYNFVSTEIAVGGYFGTSGGVLMYNFVSPYINAWSSKNWAWAIRVGKLSDTGGSWSTTPEKKGRLLGLKLITKAAGAFGDTISIAIDGNGFPDPAGTATDHWVITEAIASGRFAVVK